MRRIKSYVQRNPGATIAIVLAIGVCGLLITKNIGEDNFFSANAIDILTILLGVLIAFYLTERMNDRRRQNDCIEHIIIEIENFVADDSNFKIDKGTLMRHGSCGTRIKSLKDAGFSAIKEEIGQIEYHFNEIRDLYSSHNQSEEALESVRMNIDKHRDIIVNKCFKIRVGLYSYVKRD